MKKIKLVFIVLMITVIIPIFLYNYFKPKSVIACVAANETTVEVDYNDYVHNKNKYKGKQLFLVKDSTADNNSIEDTLINPIFLENPGDNYKLKIGVIDISQVSNLSIVQLSNNFDIKTTPSFVYLDIGEEVDILNVLSYDYNNPTTKSEFITWLYENNLWLGQYLD